jgi:hypothetical protein
VSESTLPIWLQTDNAQKSMKDLAEFVNGRTVGMSVEYISGPPDWPKRVVFQWRGEGYDGGWESLTPEETEEYLRLLAEVSSWKPYSDNGGPYRG